MNKRIYLCLAHMSGNEQKYIQEAFDTNWVVPLGPNVNEFEDDLKQFVCSVPQEQNSIAKGQNDIAKEQSGIVEGQSDITKSLQDKQVVALSAGTAAVHLALIACGVQAGDEVCVQSFTFCASSHPVKYLGATPVFIDSEKDSWNMDPELLEKAILDRKAKPVRMLCSSFGLGLSWSTMLLTANNVTIPELIKI